MKDKILTAFTIVLFVAGLGTMGWVFVKSFLKNRELTTVGETACVSREDKLTMADDSMRGTINKGEVFTALFGYYNCNLVARSELALLKLTHNMEPVVRRVHGLPGDRFEVLEASSPNTYQLKINEQIVKATNGDAYFFSAKGLPALKVFELARQGVLGANEYIVFTDVAPGTNDSSNFGIVKLTAFQAKVLTGN